MVHGNDFITLLGVRSGSSVFHVFHSILNRDNFCNLKESSLEDGVDTSTQSDITGDIDTVDGVEVDVVFVDIGRVVASDEICLVNKVGGFDRGMTESQVRNRNTARLLGVVGEVCLCIHVSMVTNNFDGVLVCTDGTVRAKTPEFTVGGTFRRGVRVFFYREGEVGDIVHDAEGEFLFCTGLGILVNSNDVCRDGVLGTKSVTAGVNRDVVEFGIPKCSNDIQIERFAKGARLFGSVENTDGLDGIGDSVDEVFWNLLR